MSPRHEQFTHKKIDDGVISMGDNTNPTVVGINNIKTKTHDDLVRTLSET